MNGSPASRISVKEAGVMAGSFNRSDLLEPSSAA
jgi:hypothetical protein